MYSSATSKGSQKSIITVSELINKIKQLVEISLPEFLVEGEVSNFKQYPSGHWYFDIIDEKNKIRCVMFKNCNIFTKKKPQNGDLVTLKARLSIYAARGDLQLIVQKIEDTGEGALQKAFEKLKIKLQQEKLFDFDRKKKIPASMTNIGVISSPSGAVIHDICAVFKRRYPLIEVTVIPVAVQGQNAAKEIVNQLKKITINQFDALIIARGGGSIEDFQPFNDENVARAIAKCPIPTISAIGHETDFTIADFVADLRAPTPTAAAEIISPDINDINDKLNDFTKKICQLITNKFLLCNEKLNNLNLRIKHPEYYIRENYQYIDNLAIRLEQATQKHINNQKHKLNCNKVKLIQYRPDKKISYNRHYCYQLQQKIIFTIHNFLNKHTNKLQFIIGKLDSSSPLKTLEKGYSIAQKQNGNVIKSAADVSLKEKLNIHLYQGKIQCQVLKISKIKKNNL